MAQPEESPAVRVAVLLARDPGDLSEFLADAAAFDAAGAEALWLDLDAVDLDPFTVAAAVAAVTFRSQLFVSMPSDETASVPSRPLPTLARLSRGRLRIVTDGDAQADPAGPDIAVVRRRTGTEPEILEQPHADGSRVWVAAALPDDRAGWRAALLEAAQQAVHGLVVAASPRLLDLLRNPDDAGDRRDLQLAVG